MGFAGECRWARMLAGNPALPLEDNAISLK